jgi:hypothetical protein
LALRLITFGARSSWRSITAGFVATLRTFTVLTFTSIAALISVPSIITIARASVIAVAAISTLSTVVAITACFVTAFTRGFAVFVGAGVGDRCGRRRGAFTTEETDKTFPK